MEQRLHWARQIIDTLRFVHSKNVIHRDLTCRNILLDAHLNAKLADFAGSSLDRCPLLVAVTASHQYPRLAISILGDIFALGSTFYEIITGGVPYPEFSNKEIKARYLKGDFPNIKSSGLIGDIIIHC